MLSPSAELSTTTTTSVVVVVAALRGTILSPTIRRVKLQSEVSRFASQSHSYVYTKPFTDDLFLLRQRVKHGQPFTADLSPLRQQVKHGQPFTDDLSPLRQQVKHGQRSSKRSTARATITTKLTTLTPATSPRLVVVVWGCCWLLLLFCRPADHHCSQQGADISTCDSSQRTCVQPWAAWSARSPSLNQNQANTAKLSARITTAEPSIRVRRLQKPQPHSPDGSSR